MLIGRLIEEIAVGWPSYHQKTVVTKNDPMYSLVTDEFPQALKLHVPGFAAAN
jgi:hypothetical protein